MKKLLFLPFFFLLSSIIYAQEDTAVIRKVFDILNRYRQNIADSISRPMTIDQFPKAKDYRQYLKRKKESDEMYLHAFFIPCSTYYVYDSMRPKTLKYPGSKNPTAYQEYVFHAKEYDNQGYSIDGSAFKKRFYTFYFMDSRHFNVIKVNTGPEQHDCIFYYNNSMIFGTSEHFEFELSANNEIVLKTTSFIYHN